MEQLCATKDKLNDIEKKTRAQYKSAEWECERKYRLTASNFGRIIKRKRNHDSLAKNLLNPKHFNSKYTAYGNKYESINSFATIPEIYACNWKTHSVIQIRVCCM